MCWSLGLEPEPGTNFFESFEIPEFATCFDGNGPHRQSFDIEDEPPLAKKGRLGNNQAEASVPADSSRGRLPGTSSCAKAGPGRGRKKKQAEAVAVDEAVGKDVAVGKVMQLAQMMQFAQISGMTTRSNWLGARSALVKTQGHLCGGPLASSVSKDARISSLLQLSLKIQRKPGISLPYCAAILLQ